MTKAVATLAQFAGQSQFAGLTLEDVAEYEKANPDNNGVVVRGREVFHEGLKKAWEERAKPN
jgi:hypothetical protein